ncbi:MAG: AAA family ATPase [Burkholderiales bacterium]
MTTADFIDAMRASGLTPPQSVTADEFQRFPGVGHERNRADRAGWCKLFADGRAGIFGDWRQGSVQTWIANGAEKQLSKVERQKLRQEIASAQREVAEATHRLHLENADNARAIWQSSPPAPGDHPYLVAKGIAPHLTRLDVIDHALIIPVYQPDGQIWSLQFIGERGDKRFMPDGKMKDGHCWLGDATGDTFLVAEGFSTGATLHQATGLPVCVAFNAGNLAGVCRGLRQRHPDARIIVAGDDDHETVQNVGIEKATKAAEMVNGVAVFPEFSDRSGQTDFNDLYRLDGLDAVQRQITAAITGPLRIRALPIDELLAMPAGEYRIKHVLPARGIAAIIGQSSAGKTFLTLDAVMAIVQGTAWFGHRIASCGVIYLAAEGEHGISRRIDAYLREFRVERSLPLEIIPSAVNLLNEPQDMKDVLLAIRDAESRIGKASVLVIDTLSRCMAGGDENSATDMTTFIANLDHLRREIDGLVIVVHHLGKDVAKGARGHSSFFAALDACIAVQRNGHDRSWSVAKSREDGDGQEFPFSLRSVTLGVDSDGEAITSCVIDPQPSGSLITQHPKPIGTNQRLVYGVLLDILPTSPHLGKGLSSGMERCVSLDELVEACRTRMPVDAKRIRERTLTAVKAMTVNQVICFYDNWIWLP